MPSDPRYSSLARSECGAATHSTSGSKISRTSSKRRSKVSTSTLWKAANSLRTTSTFSCDIAYAISRGYLGTAASMQSGATANPSASWTMTD